MAETKTNTGGAKKATTTKAKVPTKTKSELKLEKELESMKAQIAEIIAINKTQADALEEKDSILEEKDLALDELKVTQELESKNKSNKKGLPKDLDIVISSNIDGEFDFSSTKGKTNVYIRFDEMGETSVISLEDLRSFNNISNWLKSGQVAITDVEDNDYSIEEVINSLRLTKLYNDEKSIAPNKIQDMFTDKVDSIRFDQILLNSPRINDAIIQVACVLQKSGKFNDNSKIQLLKQRVTNPTLFR
jgi:hypothetical protein